MTEPGEGLLFPVSALPAPAHVPGPAERALRVAVDRAYADKTLLPEVDGPLVEGALIGARTMDTADRVGGLKGGYLAAQALPAYQKALHALRLPAEVATATAPPPPAAAGSEPSWVRDAFGTAE